MWHVNVLNSVLGGETARTDSENTADGNIQPEIVAFQPEGRSAKLPAGPFTGPESGSPFLLSPRGRLNHFFEHGGNDETQQV